MEFVDVKKFLLINVKVRGSKFSIVQAIVKIEGYKRIVFNVMF